MNGNFVGKCASSNRSERANIYESIFEFIGKKWNKDSKQFDSVNKIIFVKSMKGFTVGDVYYCSFDAESREYNDKFYTDLFVSEAHKISIGGQKQATAKPPVPVEQKQAEAFNPDDEDDLPF